MKVKDYSISGEEFELQYNEKYNYFKTTPIPIDIEKYYQSENYISHTDGKRSFFEQIYQIVKQFNLKKKIQLVEKFSVEKGKILDIGAGTADFLLRAKQQNWHITGVEPSQKAREKAREKGIFLLENQEEIEGKYQVITLWHVLEHMLNVENEVKFLYTKLSENGTLVIAVPNYKSKDAQIYGKYWAAYDVPRHIYHFSQQSIEQIFTKVGFNLVATKPMWFDAFYVSILSEKYKGNSLSFIRGIAIGLYSNICGIFSGEFSSLIYILKKKNNLEG